MYIISHIPAEEKMRSANEVQLDEKKKCDPVGRVEIR